MRYDAEIRLNPSGTFTVREIQQVRFEARFHTAFAEIPRRYTADIDNIQVWEGETALTRNGSGPGSFTVEEGGENIVVDWEYAYTEPGEVRTFILEYEVAGGLWVYADGDILEWRTVPADRSGIPVAASRVTVTLPVEVPAEELRYTAFGPPFAAHLTGRQVIFEADGSIPDGTSFQVQVGFPHGLVDARVQPWQLAEDRARLVYRIESMETDLRIAESGTVAVEERQRVLVAAGALDSGNRRVSLSTLDAIDGVEVWEGDQRLSASSTLCEYCFTVRRRERDPRWVRYSEKGMVVDLVRAGQVEIDWQFPALVKGEATTFRLRYEAQGAIQVTEEGQRLTWSAVDAGRDVPVDVATLRLHLPPGLRPAEVTVDGGDVTVEPDGTLLLTHEGPVPAGEPWQVRIALPSGATGATPPAWQRDQEAAIAAYGQAEEAARQATIRRARWQVGLGAAGLLTLVGGLVGVFLLWYVRGRDYPAALAAEYLSAPPSALPPAIVAYLIDERPSTKGALAALLHLASLGLLRIDLAGPLSLRRNWDERLVEGQTLTTASGETLTIPGHLVILFNALLTVLPTTTGIAFSKVQRSFQAALPAVYARMGEEAAHYFSEIPTVSRHRWLVAGQWVVLAGVAALVLSVLGFGGEVGAAVALPPAALIVVGLALTLVSRWMVQKSAVGAEEAARWLAFKRYLLDLKRYATLGEAQAILDGSFAFAIALDVEEVVLAQAEEMGAVVPAWTRPARLSRRPPLSESVAEPAGDRRGRVSQPITVARQVEEHTAPGSARGERLQSASVGRSLQGFSDGLARSLNEANDNLGSLLNRAAGEPPSDTPFKVVVKGAGKATELSFDAATTTLEILGKILEASASSGGGGYSSRGSRSSGSSWSSSRSSSFRSGSSSGRSSSSRSSGGGGRRGFG